MSTSQKTTKKPILDFYPAELKKGNKGEWRIEFKVLNPVDGKMKRIQRRVPPSNNKRYRERYAKQMVGKVNSKLERGWNPIVEEEAPKSLALVGDVAKQYISQLKKAVKDGEKREDTLRTYESFTNNFTNWLAENREEQLFCLRFDKKLIYDFLDEIYYVRNNSPRTHNNYLGFLVTFGNYMKDRGFISHNPAEGIESKKLSEKKRTIISKDDREAIIENTLNKHFLNLLMTIYYELIRRTEATKIKVSDIFLKEGYIRIRPEVSKNGKLQHISLIKGYIPYLVDHLKGATNNDFLFSDDGFSPGQVQLAPKKISDEWARLRKRLYLPETYQLYSFKDTGITDMLNSGVPAILVRDHARHSTVSMTEKYTPRIKGVDTSLFKSLDFKG